MLISFEKPKTILFLGEEQSLSELASKSGVHHFEKDCALTNTAGNTALTPNGVPFQYDLIICPDLRASKYFCSMGMAGALQKCHDSMAVGGKLVIGVEGRSLLTLVNIAKIKKQASRNQFKSLCMHIVYPSITNPYKTCRYEKESIKFFYKNLYPQPLRISKKCFYGFLQRTKLLALFAPGYIIEIER